MIISHSHKFIFIKTMKTASTSLEIALLNACQSGDICTPIRPAEPSIASKIAQFSKGVHFKHNSGKKVTLRQHSPLYQVAKVFGKKIIDYKIITSERNPWSKLVSSFYWKASQTPSQLGIDRPLETYESFQPYFENLVLRPVQNSCDAFDMYSHQWVPLADHIIRHEYINEDLEQVVSSLKLPSEVKLPKNKAKEIQSIRKDKLEFSPEMDAAVQQRFAREIEIFHYTKEDKYSCKQYKPCREMQSWREVFFKKHMENGWS